MTRLPEGLRKHGETRTFDETSVPAKLLDQFGTLRKPGCPERMPLGQQSARWVGHVFSAIGIVAVVHKLRRISATA